jgi:tRNA (guanine37-N1)-methyltransferase
LPPNIVERLPRSYDIIGEIALVEIEDELKTFSSIIGNGILRIHPHLRLVVEKIAKTEGQHRIRKVKPIAGHGKTETVHREFSCKFSLDVNCVYFNPRLSHERMRIAKQVKEGEVVVDMFAGVGPYSILIAKTRPVVQVFSIDLNPAAYKYLAENVFLNKVAERVSCYLGDARRYASTSLRGIADRVIMNLPSNSSEYLDTASSFLKPHGGMIHYYAFAHRNQNIEDATSTVQSLLKTSGRRIESVKYQRAIKEVAPNRVQIVLDAIIG